MTERYNEIECALGISTYASLDHKGFAGVSKARYSDFVVHEVDLNGNVAKLDNMPIVEEVTDEKAICEQDQAKQGEKEQELSPPSSRGNKRKFSDTVDGNDEKGSPQKEMEEDGDKWGTISSKLSTWVGSDITKKVIDMLQCWEDLEGKNDGSDESGNNTENSQEKYVVLPPIKDKDTRRSVHEWIRSSLPIARGDTHEGNIRIWHKKFEKDMPNYGKFDRNQSNNRPNRKQKKKKWPSDRPDYLSFVLYKENIDTGTAIKDITRRLGGGGGFGRGRHMPKVRYGYAGMKDKRGVTAQFCTLYRKEASDLLWLNQPPKEENDNRGRGGGGHTNKGGVSLIRVGSFSYVKDEIRLGMLKGNRFDIVLRNVAVSPPATDFDHDATKDLTKTCLEKAASNLAEHGFINYFGMQRFGKFYDTHKVGIAVLKGDFEEAVNIIMKYKADEPPRIATAREKWEKRFVVDKRGDVENTQPLTMNDKEQMEANCAKQIVRDLGRFMTCEVAILNCLARKPLDYKRAFSNIPKTMRMMFLHAVQSYLWNHIASHRLDTMSRNQILPGDLVLLEKKEEGTGVADGAKKNTSGLSGKTVKVVTEEDISLRRYSMTDLVLPLVGTKVEYPTNNCGALFDSLLGKEGLKKSHFKKLADPDLALGGDYRKIICKPLDVEFEVKEYRDPLQPLLHTDLMKLNKVALEENSNENANMEVLFGLVIGFTLPPSAYATIALRELMKRPTSSDYQQKLKLQGWCEEDVVDTKVSRPMA